MNSLAFMPYVELYDRDNECFFFSFDAIGWIVNIAVFKNFPDEMSYRSYEPSMGLSLETLR